MTAYDALAGELGQAAPQWQGAMQNALWALFRGDFARRGAARGGGPAIRRRPERGRRLLVPPGDVHPAPRAGPAGGDRGPHPRSGRRVPGLPVVPLLHPAARTRAGTRGRGAPRVRRARARTTSPRCRATASGCSASRFSPRSRAPGRPRPRGRPLPAAGTVRAGERDGRGRGRPRPGRALPRHPRHDDPALGRGGRPLRGRDRDERRASAPDRGSPTPRHDYARMLLARDDPRAVELLDDAASTFSELGIAD